MGLIFNGNSEEDDKGISLQTQQSNSFHSVSTVVAWSMNIFLLLRPERKCELFIRHTVGKL